VFDTYEDIFQRRADSYQRAMTLHPQARDAEFRIIADIVSSNRSAKVCDAPAGGGYLRRYLSDRVTQYIAVETTPEFINQCPSGASDTVLNCQPDAIDLPSESVDHIVSIAGTHHLPDKCAFFAEAARILQPSGCITIFDVEVDTGPAEFLNGFVDEHNSTGHSGEFLDSTTALDVAAQGLTVETNAVMPFPWSFDSEQDMGTFCALLFGIDRADISTVIKSVDRILGRCLGPKKVNLCWQMRQITARK
jgi:SAM-dependent methyltransferase